MLPQYCSHVCIGALQKKVIKFVNCINEIYKILSFFKYSWIFVIFIKCNFMNCICKMYHQHFNHWSTQIWRYKIKRSSTSYVTPVSQGRLESHWTDALLTQLSSTSCHIGNFEGHRVNSRSSERNTPHHWAAEAKPAQAFQHSQAVEESIEKRWQRGHSFAA